MKIKNLVLYLNDDTNKYDLYVADTQIVHVDDATAVFSKEIIEDIDPAIIDSWMYVLRALTQPRNVLPDKLKATAKC